MSLKSLVKCLAITAPLLVLAAGSAPAADKKAPAKPAAPAASAAPSRAIAGPASGTGKVVECMDAAAYTYVKVDFGGGKTAWSAAPQFKVKKGDTVTVAQGMPMANFHSKTLNRTFDVVYFTDNIQVKK